MRKIRIEMSKAAKDRLALLRAPDELPLPLDTDTLRPFGVRFSGSTLVVTSQGRDVAYVPDEMAMKGGFNLVTPLQPNDFVDAALRRVFGALTAHLDRVGTVLNAERRERAAEAALRQQEHEQAQGKIYAAKIKMLSEFFTHDKRKWARPFAADALSLASRFRGDDDVIRISQYSTSWGFEIADAVTISIKHDRKDWSVGFKRNSHLEPQMLEAVKRIERSGQQPNAERMLMEIERCRARTMRILDKQDVIAGLKNIPEADYNFQMFAMNVPADLNETQVSLDDKISLRIRKDAVLISQEGVHVETLHINKNLSALESPTSFFASASGQRPNINSEDWSRFGAFVVASLAAAHPDHDFDVFKVLDADDLAVEAAAMDAGYGF